MCVSFAVVIKIHPFVKAEINAQMSEGTLLSFLLL